MSGQRVLGVFTVLNSLFVGVALATGSVAGADSDPVDKLLGLSLEQLGQVEVTATSRRASRLSDTHASIYVIHGEQIQAFGIRTLPEALRLAPNLHVAQINAAGYAVTARGLKTSLSNKMLVLLDGRPIYTPLFSGVLWDMQDAPMAEIDRIEVVSGPGDRASGLHNPCRHRSSGRRPRGQCARRPASTGIFSSRRLSRF